MSTAWMQERRRKVYQVLTQSYLEPLAEGDLSQHQSSVTPKTSPQGLMERKALREANRVRRGQPGFGGGCTVPSL